MIKKIVLGLTSLCLLPLHSHADDVQAPELHHINTITGYGFSGTPLLSTDNQYAFLEGSEEYDESQRYFFIVHIETGKIKCKTSKDNPGTLKALRVDESQNFHFKLFESSFKLDPHTCEISKVNEHLPGRYYAPKYLQPNTAYDLQWNKTPRLLRYRSMGPEISIATLMSRDTGERVTFTGHQSGIYKAELSPNGKTLVTLSHDKSLRFWNAKTGQETHRVDFDYNSKNRLRFSPDGHHIILFSNNVVTNDRFTYVIEAQTGKIRYKFDSGAKLKKKERKNFNLTGRNSGSGHYDVWFSPDSQKLYAQDRLREIQVFDLKTGKKKSPLSAVRSQFSYPRTDCHDCPSFPAVKGYSVLIFDAASSEVIAQSDPTILKTYYDSLDYLARSSNYGLTSSRDGQIILYQIGTAVIIWRKD